MARRGGFPGGMPGNMNNMLKQAQRMQRQMEEQQKELEEKEFTGTAGGGAVSITISGKKTVKIAKKTTVKKTVAKLTKGKTYYVRIRSVKKVSGRTYYSAWSAKKKVKVK